MDIFECAFSLADLGGVPGARPLGSRFFRFDIQNFQNVTASGVHAPPEVHAPPTGNPGSATDFGVHFYFFILLLSYAHFLLERYPV